MLSDTDILKEIEAGNITCLPFVPSNLSNSSLDLRLGPTIAKLERYGNASIRFNLDGNGKITRTLYDACNYAHQNIEEEGYLLQPQEFILAETLEYVGQPCNFIISEVADKSTMARLGLGVCFSAGYIDAGNVLNITLEIVNHSNVPIHLQYGQHICQLKFQYLSSPCLNPYNGKYLNSKTVQEAK